MAQFGALHYDRAMRWVIALTLAVVAAAVVPALAAAPMTITASNVKFTPATVTIDVGDTVTFTNAGGTHNVVFDDGSPPMPPAPSSVWASDPQRTFTAAGTYTFHCGNPNHTDMTGSIQVGPPTPTPTPSLAPTPSPSPSPPSSAPAPLVRDVHLLRTSFCIRCRHPGVTLQLTLSRAARVRGTLTRKGHRFGRVDFGTVRAGKRTLRFTKTTARKRLARGRYKLALRIGAEPARTLRFRVS
jgi:plastocyanin